MMKLGWLLVVPALLLAGCDSSDSADVSDTDVFGDDMPGDFPAGSCAATMGGACETDGGSSGLGEGSSTAGDPADCVVDGCVGQGVCVAPWDESAEQLGEFECRFSCVPLLDDASWCANDDTCCDVQARCTDRGYCVLDGGDGSTGTGGDATGMGTSGATDTDTDGTTSGGGA